MNIAQSSLLIRCKGGLPPTPALPGSMQTLACRRMPLAFFDWCRRTQGDRFTLYPLPTPPVVFLSHPGDIRAVLNAPGSVLHPGAGGAAIGPIVGGRSFMLREADEHMQGRRTILPAFAASALERHTQMVSEIVSAEVASWPLDSAFPVHPRLRSMSLRIILSTVFQRDPATLASLHAHMLKMLDVTASFTLVEPRLRHLPVWRGIWRRFTEEREHVDREIRKLIAHGRADPTADDVLARLLVASNPDGSPMTPGQVRDNLVSIILAGHETTASQIAWALQLLAHTPHAQSRLADEIDADRGDRYLRATVAEVLRHRPVFLFAIPRVVVEPIEIRGWTYSPPAQLLGCIYLLHHDPELHADPHAFRPERFFTGAASSNEWLPWGGGRKRCPGHRLATLEMRAVIRATLETRTLAPAAPAIERARWRSVIVTPARGGRVVLHQRQTRAYTGAPIAG
jgi:cytochrome P450